MKLNRHSDHFLPDAVTIHEVEVVVWHYQKNGAVQEPSVKSQNSKAIAQLVDVLKTAVETKDHRCAARGKVILKSSDRNFELSILPGHNPGRYEFRFNDHIYFVPRNEFVRAMETLGVIDMPLTPR